MIAWNIVPQRRSGRAVIKLDDDGNPSAPPNVPIVSASHSFAHFSVIYPQILCLKVSNGPEPPKRHIYGSVGSNINPIDLMPILGAALGLRQPQLTHKGGLKKK